MPLDGEEVGGDSGSDPRNKKDINKNIIVGSPCIQKISFKICYVRMLIYRAYHFNYNNELPRV